MEKRGKKAKHNSPHITRADRIMDHFLIYDNSTKAKKTKPKRTRLARIS